MLDSSRSFVQKVISDVINATHQDRSSNVHLWVKFVGHEVVRLGQRFGGQRRYLVKHTFGVVVKTVFDKIESDQVSASAVATNVNIVGF